jgi:asparagine synthase (glutamine-hydrolysing)
MCGICGIVSKNPNEITVERLKKITDLIHYRGPDGDGHWINLDNNVGLGHRRLSIIDLSHEADQPMHYSGRYSIVFNGEIYNYIELKEILLNQGYIFKTSSDTEVLMALYQRDKENCLQFLDGMFSFAIYDDEEKEIFAARDRFGEKPFYYSYKPGEYFLFGSEMKCLWAAGVPKEVNNQMLFNYLSYGNLQNPQNQSETFFNNCLSLPHSHYLKLSVTNVSLSITKYYDIDYENINHSITEIQAKEKFRELFYTSVSRRLRSDVAVGSSLSGGLDSSLVVCVIDELKKGTTQKQNTFSAVFPGFIKDERKYIDYVIAKSNVCPHFTTPDNDGLTQDLEKLFWHQEEPFGSASIYVQYCVMRIAKENNVTVLLDGQGADEYLAGYHQYYTRFFIDLKANYPDWYNAQYDQYVKLHEDNSINPRIKKDIRHFVRSSMPHLIKPAKRFVNYYKQKTSPLFSDEFYATNSKNNFARKYYFKNLNGALYESLLQGGLQSLLRYADRNSMAHSREVRLPFLFHELVDFVFSLPPYFKIRNGWTKWIMRSAFSDTLPRPIAWRKDKIGYEPPQKDWLESDGVKEKIHESKRKLYEHKIISKKEYESKIVAENSLDVVNKPWQLWMAGELF